MTLSQLQELIREVMQEMNEANVTNAGGASFTPGAGAQYATPNAFVNGNREKKSLKKIGYKQVSRPKRPSHTKGFDYL